MKEWIENRFEGHLELLERLAAVPAPSHREDKRAAFLLNELEKMGYAAYADGAKNVVVPLGEELPGKFTVYMAHTDVVFPDEDVLPVRREGGRLYAPGVGDDTANVTAILRILAYVREKGLKPKEPLLFVLNSCEEGLGNLKGVREIMRAFEGRVREVVSFDCSMDEGFVVRAVGSERWRVTAKTRGGHSWGAFGRPNAIHRMAELVAKLYKQEVPEIENARTTYNVGGISGGTSINTIAPECEILYEYRSDDRRGLEAMRESFMRLLAEADGAETRFEAELLGERPCGGSVDPEAQEGLKRRCMAAFTEVTGKKPPEFAASTDANIPLSLGIPAVTFGLYVGDGAHTREEWLDIESLKTGLLIGLKLVCGAHFEDGDI